MDTPICDFVRTYVSSDPMRLHMPGHKGINFLGFEDRDITEIDGADSLYEANSIIQASERNASRLFGCRTYYSTEGASLCIRAMLYLCMLYSKQEGKEPLIAAARNVHSAFIRAAAMLDFDIHWLYGDQRTGYLSCTIDPDKLDNWLSNTAVRPMAVYLTSPDYLGNISDIRTISQICHKYGVLLIVDNAHGAYLKFLPESIHPIDLGADLCCDSAHKTLPVLTGGAYLHISDCAPKLFYQFAKQALAMFGSTSPSYLILQSLDAANKYLDCDCNHKLEAFLAVCEQAKADLLSHGYSFVGNEPLKWTIDAKEFGYMGYEIADYLKKNQVHVEFSDPDYLVMMLSPGLGADGLEKLTEILTVLPKRSPLLAPSPIPMARTRILTPRQAAFAPSEFLPIEQCFGRVLASPSVGCPPAVPIVVCGEQIDENAIACFKYYGISTCCVTIT